MNIAKIIDHTNIRIDATEADIKKSCEEAKKYGFRSVVVNPEWVSLVNKELRGNDVKTAVLIDPPIGDSLHSERIKICQKAKENGADELDVVINIPAVKHERYHEISEDLREISQILPTKVIIGSGYLTDEEIKKTSEIVKESGAICVKTATVDDPLDNTELDEKAKHIGIMRESAPGILVKASGAIRSFDDVERMVAAGADIIGTSSGVE